MLPIDPSRSEKRRIAIVGAGLAGLEVATCLAANPGIEVILIEAGPDSDRRHINLANDPENADRLWLEPGRDVHHWRPWTSETPPHFQGQSGLRARLGGRGLYWYGVCLPIESWALADPAWPRAVVRDLGETWQGGRPLYQQIGDELKEWAGWTDDGRRLVLADRALAPMPRYVKQQSGRWSAWASIDCLDRPNVTLLDCSKVEHVLVEDCRAKGLVVSGKAAPLVEADTIVLAAGAIESARLAHGARQQAGEPPPPLRLSDHLVTGVFGRFSGEVAQRMRSSLPNGRWYASIESARSNLFVECVSVDDASFVLDLQMTGEQLLDDGAELTFGVNGSETRISANLGKEDEMVLVLQRSILLETWLALWQKVRMPPPHLSFPRYAAGPGNAAVLDLPNNSVVCWTNEIGTEDHEFGSWPFGPLLDADCQVNSVGGLFMAGPAVFPRAGAANPALTILALARRLGHDLAARPRMPT